MICQPIKRMTTFLPSLADPICSVQHRSNTSRRVKAPSGFSTNGEQGPSSFDARNYRSPMEIAQAIVSSRALAVVATAKGSL